MACLYDVLAKILQKLTNSQLDLLICDTFNVAPRFDEDIGKVELDYPRDMSMWSGVGYNIDTVFQWKDGKY